tara:strand:+ start:2099 stop:2458 length:360 start_codon:yes stop_codon:yes gene_type:complete
MVKVVMSGVEFEIEKDSTAYKNIVKAAEAAHERDIAESVEKGMQVIKKAMKDAYMGLAPDLKTAMTGKAIVARLTGTRFDEISTYTSTKVMIRQRTARAAKSTAVDSVSSADSSKTNGS